MSREAREALVVAVDVGEGMSEEARAIAHTAVGGLLQSRLLVGMHQMGLHDASLIRFGTASTNNKAADDLPGEGLYQHITVDRALGSEPPLDAADLAHLLRVLAHPEAHPHADHAEVLAVALQEHQQHCKGLPLKNVVRRVMLLSNFAREPDESIADILEPLRAAAEKQAVELTLLVLPLDEKQGQLHANVLRNVQQLKEGLGGRLAVHVCPSAVSAAGVALGGGGSNLVPRLGRPYRNLDLVVGPDSDTGPGVPVSIYKRTFEPRDYTRGFAGEAEKSRPSQVPAVEPINIEDAGDSAQERAPKPEKRYRYAVGESVVELSKAENDALAFRPGPCFRLLGFVAASAVPDWAVMDSAYTVLPRRGDGTAAAALAAMRVAMRERGVVGVVRWAATGAHPAVRLYVMAPAAEHDCCMTLGQAPLMDDFRATWAALFPPLPQDVGNGAQNSGVRAAVRDYVGAMRCSDDSDPEALVDPGLLRGLAFLQQRAEGNMSPMDAMERWADDHEVTTTKVAAGRPAAAAALAKLSDAARGRDGRVKVASKQDAG
ncbi:unnamed protein product [Pedinophyceae sp. YPF-701]|nr:unnamed protein product [Pedinophyceae sp. YPF-701]